MVIDLAQLTTWQKIWLPVVVVMGVFFVSFWFRWFFGTLHIHEDLQKILDELKKLREEKK